ncbi:MAG: ImmA/IrrE family metallo-endopeptidase [Pseudomonadota bacterium]
MSYFGIMQTFQTLEAAREHWLTRQSPRTGKRPASRVARTQLVRLGEVLLREAGLARPHEIATWLHGRVWYENGQRKLLAPWPTTSRVKLYVLAHELGHWLLHCPNDRRRNPDQAQKQYRREYEAECFAQQKLRTAGIAVPREMLRHAKDYVTHYLRLHIR